MSVHGKNRTEQKPATGLFDRGRLGVLVVQLQNKTRMHTTYLQLSSMCFGQMAGCIAAALMVWILQD